MSLGPGLTDQQLRATPVPVSAASLPLPTDAATEATLAAMLSALAQQGTLASVLSLLIAALDTTLSSRATEATLLAIKSTAGIKKIVDELPAGTQVIGKVGIDQTTAGTTNAVAPISGQAGVDGNAGAASAKTQRVIHATDDLGTVSLGVIDDWDESDRAKVNPIVGQAGVAAGAGAVGATVPRVTLASDDPAVTSLALMDDVVKTDDAAFTVGTDKVSMAGHVAVARGAAPDAADANDAVARVTNRSRVPFVIGGHPYTRTFRKNYTTAQTDTTILTPTSGKKLVITRCTATLAGSCSVDVSCTVGLAQTNTPTDEGSIISHPGIVKGSGDVEGNGGGELGVGATNDKLLITCSVPTGGSITVVGTYHELDS